MAGVADPEAGECAAEKLKNYPRTPHLPYSPGRTSDDKSLTNADAEKFFVGKKIVVTEKMDGGNACVRNGKVYARSHSHPATHASFSSLKTLAASWSYLYEPEGSDLRDCWIFGENLEAVHSIEYDALPAHFMLFAVAGPDGKWWSWRRVEAVAKELGVPTPRVIFRDRLESGKQLEDLIMEHRIKPSCAALVSPETEATAAGPVLPEGFVVRLSGSFPVSDFGQSVAKFVAAGHVQTGADWRRTWKKAKVVEDVGAGVDAGIDEDGERKLQAKAGCIADIDVDGSCDADAASKVSAELST